jgi:hypothetical protein
VVVIGAVVAWTVGATVDTSEGVAGGVVVSPQAARNKDNTNTISDTYLAFRIFFSFILPVG